MSLVDDYPTPLLITGLVLAWSQAWTNEHINCHSSVSHTKGLSLHGYKSSKPIRVVSSDTVTP